MSSSDSDIALVNEEEIAKTRDEIKTLNVNMARLKRDLPEIIHREINEAIKEIIQELRRPVERGYSYRY